MARGELVSFQLTLPDAGGEIGLIPQYAKGPRGQPPMLLSQTRVEAAARYLDHPGLPITDPRCIPTEHHLRILLGIALHRVAQLSQIWQSARPTDIRGYKPEYYRRLTKIAAELAPTAKPSEVRTAVAILATPQMAMPRLRSPRFEKEERTVYQRIAAAVAADIKTRPPFTQTLTLPAITAMAALNRELPFPDPEVIEGAWNHTDQDQRLLRLTDRLFDYHQAQPIRPADHHSSKSSFTCYASELRLTARLGDLNAVWSGRLDEVTRGISPEPPHVHVRAVDYKASTPNFPPAGTYSRAATRASMMMTARLLAALPDHIPPAGKAVKVAISPARVNPDVEVFIDYVGLGGDRIQQIKFGDYWSPDWSSSGKARQETEGFFDLLATIRSRPELEPFWR